MSNNNTDPTYPPFKIALTILLVLIAFGLGQTFERTSIERKNIEAVKSGAAVWVSDKNGEPVVSFKPN